MYRGRKNCQDGDKTIDYEYRLRDKFDEGREDNTEGLIQDGTCSLVDWWMERGFMRQGAWQIYTTTIKVSKIRNRLAF